jgi:predicted helicase
LYSLGLNTNRDAWVYNSSKDELGKNIKKHINFYNQQVDDYIIALQRNKKISINDFKDNSPNKISWSSSLEDNLKRQNKAKYEKNKIMCAAYRPFYKQYLYNGDKMIHRPGQFNHLFPIKENENLLICINGVGFRKDVFSSVITNNITDLEYVEKTQGNLFENVDDNYIRHDAISNFILEQAQTRYGPKVTKEDIFYYVYGILHSPDYRKTFANDLKKMLPRLPLVEVVADFWSFSKAGKKLAEIHIDYEDQERPKKLELMIVWIPIPRR